MREVLPLKAFRPASVPAGHATAWRDRASSGVVTRPGIQEAHVANVLVIDVSRGIGLETVKAALAAGHRVGAFTRSASGITLPDQGLENFTGNAVDAGDIVSALNGVDVVIQTLGVPMKHLMRSVLLFSDATSVLVPAMAKVGVRRILAVTGFGTSDSRLSIRSLQRLPFRLMLVRACDDKDAQEMRISGGGSGPAWTLVRPGILTRRRRHGPLRELTEPRGATAWSPG